VKSKGGTVLAHVEGSPLCSWSGPKGRPLGKLRKKGAKYECPEKGKKGPTPTIRLLKTEWKFQKGPWIWASTER